MHKRICKTLQHYLVVLPFLLNGMNTQAVAESYAVVVNAKNTVVEKNVRHQIKRLYLKQQKRWTNGLPATIFNRGKETSEDKVFRDIVLKMSANELSNHWLSVKQRTGEAPPRTIISTRTLLKLISRYEGSFGVVNQTEVKTIPDSLRVLWTFSN